MTTVIGSAGERIEGRMPTPAERRQLGMPEGIPMIVLIRQDGREDLYDSRRTSVLVPAAIADPGPTADVGLPAARDLDLAAK
jgi:hypothetical protein